jgi:hypothetical protein
MLYTVVIDTGDAGQDEVLEQLQALEAVVVVQFMGRGALVGPDEPESDDPCCEACGVVAPGGEGCETRAGFMLCGECDRIAAVLASGAFAVAVAVERFGGQRVEHVRALLR